VVLKPGSGGNIFWDVRSLIHEDVSYAKIVSFTIIVALRTVGKYLYNVRHERIELVMDLYRMV
jgi:hypothetical protein